MAKPNDIVGEITLKEFHAIVDSIMVIQGNLKNLLDFEDQDYKNLETIRNMIDRIDEITPE
jgi:hypothetical protein